MYLLSLSRLAAAVPSWLVPFSPSFASTGTVGVCVAMGLTKWGGGTNWLKEFQKNAGQKIGWDKKLTVGEVREKGNKSYKSGNHKIAKYQHFKKENEHFSGVNLIKIFWTHFS